MFLLSMVNRCGKVVALVYNFFREESGRLTVVATVVARFRFVIHVPGRFVLDPGYVRVRELNHTADWSRQPARCRPCLQEATTLTVVEHAGTEWDSRRTGTGFSLSSCGARCGGG